MGSDRIEILLVDDEPDLAGLAAEFLQRENESFHVRTANDAESGLEILDEARIDCVVSDYDMPGQNGIEFLESIQATHTDIPFILYTGKGSEEIASEAIRAGVDDYLQKSPGREQYALLANRISNAVEKYRSLEEVASTRRFYTKLIEHSTDVIPVIGEDGTLKYLSPSAELHLGYKPADVVGDDVWDYIHPDDLERATEKFFETIENPDSMPEVRFRFKHADGSWVRLHGRAKNLLEDPDIEGVVSYNRVVDE
jgi:PAS domain S-box-containing protein